MSKELLLSKQAQGLIASLRGLPVDAIRPDFHTEHSIDQLLTEVIKKVNSKKSLEQAIMGKWRTIVGERYAPRCAPCTVADGVLVVNVFSSVVREALRFEKRKILQEIRKLEDCQSIKDIHFRAM